MFSEFESEYERFPGMDVFHGEMLIGNTIIGHQPLSAHIYPAHWNLGLVLRQLRARLNGTAKRTCRCGWCGPEVFGYHVAREVIAALSQYGRYD